MEADEIVRRMGLPIVIGAGGQLACPVCLIEHPLMRTVGVHMMKHWKEAGVDWDSVPKGKDKVKCPRCNSPFTRGSLAGHLTTHGMAQAEAIGFCRTYGFDLDTYAHVEDTPKVKYNVRIAELSPEDQEALRTKWREDSARKRGERSMVKVQCPLCEFACLRKNLSAHLQTKRHGLSPAEANRIARDGAPPRQERNLPAVQTQSPPPSDLVDPTEAALAVVQSQVNGHGVPAHLLPDVMQYVDHTRELAQKLRDL